MTLTQSARAAYLGYPLEITDRDVTVFDKRGRRLATVASIGAAHRFIKGYRRVPGNADVSPLQQVTSQPAPLSRGALHRKEDSPCR